MGDLPFPKSLPEFQKLFPDDAHCAAYMERVRWPDGFVCPSCETAGDPGRVATRPHVLRCKACKKEARLTAGTVMQDSHTPLLTWFWGAYLVASLTPGMSAVQFQRQLGLGRYETAFQILHKLRAGMVRRDVDMIGGVHTASGNTRASRWEGDLWAVVKCMIRISMVNWACTKGTTST